MNLLSTIKNSGRNPLLVCLTIAVSCSFLFTLVAYLGLLQGMELMSYDEMLLLRKDSAVDDRIVMLAETESDIRRYGHPLSDQVLADAITALEKAEARVIGVDKYRDFTVGTGNSALTQILKEKDNVIWVFFGGNNQHEFIPAPNIIMPDQGRVGFSDVIEDPDGVSRRGLLFMDYQGKSYYAFPLLVAIHYLDAINIRGEGDEQGFLTLGGVSFPRLDSRFGGYNGVDNGGYQIMLDYPGLPYSFPTYTLSDLLDGKIPKLALQDKIVLVGGMAPSLHDYRLLPGEIRRFGVEHHAYVISQILNTALLSQPPLSAWSEIQEYAWLLFWCLLGVLTGYKKSNIPTFVLLLGIELVTLLILTWFSLQRGYWIPLISPLLGWTFSLAGSVLYFYNRESSERQQLMRLFESHVSPEVATRLWDTREQFFSEGGVKPDMLTATVLFVDIVNFTTIAEAMEPIALMAWLNQYMDSLSRVVIEHGGMVNKYIGDAIMAVFGVPVKSETEEAIALDAKRAVQCALAFDELLVKLNFNWVQQGLPTVSMRVGIHTGPLVAGSCGGALRTEYTVVGDTVNTASRLEGFDKSFKSGTAENICRILIGDTTFHYVGNLYPTEIVGACELKGKQKPINIYHVLNSKTENNLPKEI